MKKGKTKAIFILSLLAISSLLFVEGIFSGYYDFNITPAHVPSRKPVPTIPLIQQYNPKNVEKQSIQVYPPSFPYSSERPPVRSDLYSSVKLDTITYPTTTPKVVMRGNDILITGILWTGPYDLWNNESVSLYWNINSTTLTNIISNNADPKTYLDNNYLLLTNTTDDQGRFVFRISTDQSESSVASKLGVHDFVVYFWGDTAKGREPGIAGSGQIEIRGIINFDVSMTTASELSAGSSVYYVFKSTLKFDNGSYVSTPNVKINFTESRTGLKTPTGTIVTQISDYSAQPVTYTNAIGEQSPPGGQITVYYSLYGNSLTNLTTQYPYFNITNVPSGSQTINVTVDINFQITLWNGTAYEIRDYVILRQSQYFAANVTLSISDGTQSNPVTNRNIRLILTQNDVVKYNVTLTSNAQGIVIFNTTIDSTTYTQVGDKIIATFTYLNTSETVKPGYVQQFTIILEGNVSSISASINNPDDFRLLSESIIVTGNVNDTLGNPAKNVVIFVFYNYSLNPQYFKTLTDSNGKFNLTIDFSQLNATGKTQDSINLYVNFIPTPQPYTGQEDVIWQGSLTDILISTINIVHSISAAFETYELNATNGQTLSQNIFNTTFVQYYNGSLVSSVTGVSKLFYIKVIDQAGRIPVGFNINIYFDAQAIISLLITTTSTNPFKYDPSGPETPLNETKFITGGTFNWEIKIVRGTTAMTTISTSYTLYGPDIQKPQFPNGVIETPAKNVINGQLVPRYNVTISVTVIDPESDDTGIKNVVLYYRYWFNDSYSLNDNDYIAVLMQTTDNITWSYTILFPDASVFGGETPHGKWVQYFIVAYDYAGFGHDISTGTRFSTPKYDANFSNEARLYANRTAKEPFMYQLGDANPPSVDLGNNVIINGTRLNVFIGNTQDPSVLNITVTIFDLGGVTGANISYRTRLVAYNATSGTFYNLTDWSAFQTIPMHLLFQDTVNSYYTYYILINATNQYQVELDFYISAKDIGQNILNTPTASTYLESTQGTDARLPKVVDITPPTQVGTTQAIADVGPIENNYVFSNHTTSEVNVTLVFTDTQTGIDPNATIIEMKFYSSANTSQIFAEGIITFDPFQNNTLITFSLTVYDVNGFGKYNMTAYVLIYYNSSGYLVIKFTFPALPQEFVDNSEEWGDNIIAYWAVTVKDHALNEVVVSQQYTYERVLPPPPATPINSEEQQGGPNIYLIIVLFLVTVVAVMVFYRWRSIMDWLKHREQLDRISSSLRQKLDEINRLGVEGKYRRAVILAYRAMEEIASNNLYAPRLENQTVREFADYLADLTAVSRDTLMIIAEAYEKAKYSNEEITYEDFDNVVKALEVTIQTITRLGVKAFEE